MKPSAEVLAYYSAPGAMTDVGPHADAAHRIGSDIGDVVNAVQGMLLYDMVAKPFYGVDIPAERADEVNLRSARAILDQAVALHAQPIDMPRPPEERAVGRCRDFTVLTVALLRANGVPARARCGFGAYFGTGHFEDHWVAECWDAHAHRWRLVDAQLDETWIKMIGFSGDPFDVQRDEFVIAGRAWQACRSGAVSPQRYGLSAINEFGLHWVAGNTRLDLAALNQVEMLPWDVWGLGWEPGTDPPADLTPFDDAAALTVDADARFDAMRERYERDDNFRMPGRVFNVLRGRDEAV